VRNDRQRHAADDETCHVAHILRIRDLDGLTYDLLYPLFIYTIRSARNHQDGRMPRYSPKDYRIRGAPMLRRAEKQLTLTIKQHNRGRRR